MNGRTLSTLIFLSKVIEIETAVAFDLNKTVFTITLVNHDVLYIKVVTAKKQSWFR